MKALMDNACAAANRLTSAASKPCRPHATTPRARPRLKRAMGGTTSRLFNAKLKIKNAKGWMKDALSVLTFAFYIFNFAFLSCLWVSLVVNLNQLFHRDMRID